MRIFTKGMKAIKEGDLCWWIESEAKISYFDAVNVPSISTPSMLNGFYFINLSNYRFLGFELYRKRANKTIDHSFK